MAKAIEADPAQAVAYCNRGSALLERGQLEAALAHYDRAIAFNRDLADAHSNRGVVLTQLRRFEAALASLDRAIKLRAHYAEAHFNRGNVLKELKRPDAALASYDRAIAINPRYVQAYFNRGNLLGHLGRWSAALASFDQVIALSPSHADAHLNRGNMLQELKQHKEALASYDQAILINGSSADAFSNRGTALRELGQFDAALASLDRAIALKPDAAQAHCNKGNVLRELRELDAALGSYRHAVAIQGDFAEAYANLAVLLTELQQFDAAFENYARAIALKSNYAEAYTNRAMAYLLLGDFEQGWRDYEWRGKRFDSTLSRKKFSQPYWRGDRQIAGKTLLLYGEQGLGDTLQFCRYATLAAEQGATVIVEAPKPLANVLIGLKGVSHVIVEGDPLPAFDYQCSLMSLPLAFKTTLATVPALTPYLKCSPDRLSYWQSRLGERRKPRVGLVWSGGHRPGRPELDRRNIPLARLAPLRHADIEFYNLQKGQPAESEWVELEAINWHGPQLIDFTAELRDFADTAALIEQLDLVISVDTSTAHLTGALGKPVWILNRFDSCWRWLLERTDSPWYPTATLYRQQKPGDWAGVVERVRADLHGRFVNPAAGVPNHASAQRSKPGGLEPVT